MVSPPVPWQRGALASVLVAWTIPRRLPSTLFDRLPAATVNSVRRSNIWRPNWIGSAIITEPDHNDAMESCIGLAVTTVVEPIPVGLTGGNRYRVYPAQRGEGRLGVEALGVTPSSDHEGRRRVGSYAEDADQGWGCGPDADQGIHASPDYRGNEQGRGHTLPQTLCCPRSLLGHTQLCRDSPQRSLISIGASGSIANFSVGGPNIRSRSGHPGLAHTSLQPVGVGGSSVTREDRPDPPS